MPNITMIYRLWDHLLKFFTVFFKLRNYSQIIYWLWFYGNHGHASILNTTVSAVFYIAKYRSFEIPVGVKRGFIKTEQQKQTKLPNFPYCENLFNHIAGLRSFFWLLFWLSILLCGDTKAFWNSWPYGRQPYEYYCKFSGLWHWSDKERH